MKRVISLILAAVMVFALLPNFAFAAEKNLEVHDSTREYIFGTASYGSETSTTALNDYYNAETVKTVSDQWNLVVRTGTNWMQMRNTANGSNFQWNAYQYNSDHQVTVAIQIEVDEAGVYVPELCYNTMTDGYIHDVYLIKDDGSTVWDNNIADGGKRNEIKARISEETPIAVIDMWGEEKVTKTAKLDPVTVNEGEEGKYLFILVSNGYNEKMNPYHPDERTFIRCEINSLKLTKDVNAEAVANGTLTYNLGMSAMNGSQMWTKSGDPIVDGVSVGWNNFPGLRNTSVKDGVGSLYNISLMNWDAVVEYDNTGTKVDTPIQVMNFANTDPWSLEYCDVYNNYMIMFSSSDTAFFNLRLGTADDPDYYATTSTAFFSYFLLFKVKVPYAGKYELAVNKSSSAVENGPVPALYFFPVDEENDGITSKQTALTRIKNATAEEKLGYVNLSTKEIDGCIDKAIVSAPEGGEYYIAMKLDETSVQKNATAKQNSSADPHYQNAYFNEITLTPVETDSMLDFDISASKTTLAAGETASISATATYTKTGTAAYTSEITYSSSSPTIATVSSDGTIEALCGGTALISAEAADGAHSSVMITVNDESTEKGVSYAVSTSLDPDSIKVENGTRGDEVTVTADDISGYKFRHWVRGTAENGTWLSSDKSYTFSLMTNTYLTAVYTEDTTDKIVEFFNENGEYYTEKAVNGDGTVTLPADPMRTGYKFLKWLLSEDEVLTSDTVLSEDVTRAVARYEDSGDLFEVTLPDSTSASYAYGDKIEQTSAYTSTKDNVTTTKEYNSYWYRDGKQVYYGKTYTYYVWDDTVITNSLSGVEAPTVVLDKTVKSGNAYMIEYDTMGADVIEVGIIFGDGSQTIESCDSKATSQNTAGHGQFTAKPAATGGTIARGYLIYNDGGTYRVIYSK